MCSQESIAFENTQRIVKLNANGTEIRCINIFLITARGHETILFYCECSQLFNVTVENDDLSFSDSTGEAKKFTALIHV